MGEAHDGSGFEIRVYASSEDRARARAYLDGLVERARTATNPFFGRVLEGVSDRTVGLTFQVAELEAVSREDVILPGRLWEQLDRNVHGFFAAVDRLRAAGLNANRGILLDGPPGTGKTALCRALAAELPGVTKVFCDATSVAELMRPLYQELEDLAPAMVVLEDVDLVVGNHAEEEGRS